MSDRSEAEGGLGVTTLPAEPDTDEEEAYEEPRFFQDPKRLLITAGSVVLLIAAIYFLFPAIVGVEDGLAKLDDGDPVWITLAVAFCFLMFLAQIAMFKGVVGGDVLKLSWKESYQINMASLAASRLFSAGGAGGLLLTYWALRKAGMPRRQSAARMVAFLVVMYTVYLLALVICGILLRTGVLAGANPPGLTIVPAAIAGGIFLLVVLAALIPGDLQRRLAQSSSDSWFGRLSVRLATVPATVSTSTRMAIEIIKIPRRGWLTVAGAVGFWAANIAIMWASFEAFGLDVSGAVVVQGFFVGMAANLIPGAPGGVGAVDAGMIGTYVLFGLDGSSVFAAVLMYRFIAFWLPLPPGIVAFFQLRRTISRWEEEEDCPADRGTGESGLPQEVELLAAAKASKSKVSS
ncbi:MAG TPA: lysylphosphatidylglycerol synthase transmembrane domain-containing protein [Solirubrobacterales bacterium]|nr:lysylphosphatidylglycerol synthase transmembrane domain-containing protein [Solirubrobacterales bacterium]